METNQHQNARFKYDIFQYTVYDTIIVAVKNDNVNDGIWFLDLLNVNYKWIKSNKCFDKDYMLDITPIITNFYIHFIVDIIDKKHFKIKIKNFLPKSLCKKYGLMYLDIVLGYFKQIKKEYTINYRWKFRNCVSCNFSVVRSYRKLLSKFNGNCLVTKQQQIVT